MESEESGWLVAQQGKKCPVNVKCCYWTWVTAVLHAATGWSTARSRLPSALVTPCWGPAAAQCYPALGATTSFACSRLSSQPAKVQMHKALHYQQLSTVGSFSFVNSAFVFRL